MPVIRVCFTEESRWLQERLAVARGLGLSVAEATERITRQLKEYCMGRNFFPHGDLKIDPELEHASIQVLHSDYKTVRTIAA